MRQELHQRLANQTCIVTGADSGIGRAVALAMAKDGANVVIDYIGGPEEAEEMAHEIENMPNEAKGLPFLCDVTKEDQVINMFETARKEFSTVDILVANAGLQRDAPFHEMTLKQWQTVIDVNLTGQFLCAREAVKEYLRRGMRPDVSCALGKIIHMSSVHEIIPWAGHANYAASKGAIIMLMESLAQEYGRQKIRVNSIAPGAIRTKINKSAWSTEAALNKLKLLIPYDRIGEPKDVGNLATWLASDESDYITGTTIFIDGGMTCYPGFTENG